jgi:hypothetical protein
MPVPGVFNTPSEPAALIKTWEITLPFYGYDRPGATISEAVRQHCGNNCLIASGPAFRLAAGRTTPCEPKALRPFAPVPHINPPKPPILNLDSGLTI